MENPPYPVALRTPEQLESLFPEAAEPDISDIGENLPGSERRYGIVPGKKAEGATYTPRDLSDFVADQIIAAADIPAGRRLRVLDPALGHGELLCSLLDRLPAGVDVFAFETDPAALSVASERLTAGYPQAKLHLVEGSFLDHVLDDFSSGLFSEGESYDLVIANPPYVRTQIIGSRRAQELASQFGLSGRVDLYFAFLLGIARVLNPAGSAGIIVSNRFMTTRSGGVVREALSKVLSLRRIFDLGDTKLFDAAVLPAVIVANGRTAGEASAPASFTAIYETKTKRADFRAESALAALPYSGVAGLPDGRVFEIRHGSLHTNQNPADVWRLCSEDVAGWLATVEANSRGQFKDIGKVRVGVKTCADKVFVRREWPAPLELLRPLTTHKIARRFRPDGSRAAMRILYPHEVVNDRRRAVDLQAYPLSRAYLESHRDVLTGRSYVLEAGREWYEIWVPQNPADWSGPKLVFRDISERPTFWMDLDDTIVNGDCYWLKPEPGKDDLLWLALAVANSSFIEKFYDCRFNNKLYAGRRRFITQYVEQFPIPDPDAALSRRIVGRAKRLFERLAESDDAELEAELDAMVWQSFGLSVEKV